MAGKTVTAGVHYFVVPTLRDGRRLVPGTPQEVPDEGAARNRLGTMPRSAVGMAAYEVEMDAEGEQVSEPILIAAAGRIPGALDVAQDGAEA